MDVSVQKKDIFSIWLPSGLYSNLYPDNTLTKYTVRLPEYVNIDADNFTVGVKEILINARVFNVSKSNANFSLIDLNQKETSKHYSIYFDPATTLYDKQKNEKIGLSVSQEINKNYITLEKFFRGKTPLGFLKRDGFVNYIKPYSVLFAPYIPDKIKNYVEGKSEPRFASKSERSTADVTENLNVGVHENEEKKHIIQTKKDEKVLPKQKPVQTVNKTTASKSESLVNAAITKNQNVTSHKNKEEKRIIQPENDEKVLPKQKPDQSATQTNTLSISQSSEQSSIKPDNEYTRNPWGKIPHLGTKLLPKKTKKVVDEHINIKMQRGVSLAINHLVEKNKEEIRQLTGEEHDLMNKLADLKKLSYENQSLDLKDIEHEIENIRRDVSNHKTKIDLFTEKLGVPIGNAISKEELDIEISKFDEKLNEFQKKELRRMVKVRTAFEKSADSMREIINIRTNEQKKFTEIENNLKKERDLIKSKKSQAEIKTNLLSRYVDHVEENEESFRYAYELINSKKKLITQYITSMVGKTSYLSTKSGLEEVMAILNAISEEVKDTFILFSHEKRKREAIEVERKKRHIIQSIMKNNDTLPSDDFELQNDGILLGERSLNADITLTEDQSRDLIKPIKITHPLLDVTTFIAHFKLRPGVYLSRQSIINEINALLDTNNNNFKGLHLTDSNGKLHMTQNGKVVREDILIRLSRFLQVLFNSPAEVIRVKDFEKLLPDIDMTPTYFSPRITYIYSDIVDFSYIGDTKARLLCSFILPVDQIKSYAHLVFSDPHYVKVSKANFQDITIDIRDNAGNPIPFDKGDICIKLDFKQN